MVLRFMPHALAGFVSVASLAGLAGLTQAASSTEECRDLGLGSTTSPQSRCPPFPTDTFQIDAYQLYPENAKFDFNSCLVYFGILFNASVGVYDPYNQNLETITLPGISGDPKLHVGPALPDGHGGLSIVVDAAAPFMTDGKDVSGTNYIIKYDLHERRVAWKRNITELTKGKWGGFQDVQHDSDGNIYVVGTYPGTVVRIDKDGKHLTPFFLPPEDELADTTKAGFAGLAYVADQDLLLSNRGTDGEIYRFDKVSTSYRATPVKVPRTDACSGDKEPKQSAPIGHSDAILLPRKYNNQVLLVVENAVGVWVIRSRDCTWESAETVGLVPVSSKGLTEGALAVATVQIGPNALFSVEEWFGDAIVEGTNAGNRSSFPLVGITKDVDELLKRCP